MQYTTVIALLLSAAPLAFAQDDNQSYFDSVCSPADSDSTVIPPCISVQNIESQCAPRGKTPADFAASQKCICEAPSTYFEDWLGCRKCLEVHGAFSERQYNAYVLQASAASASMCEGTPTADIAAVFASAVPQGEPTGATSTKDQFPSDAAVSNYYKPKGEQGPGPTITDADSAPSETGSANDSDSDSDSDSELSGSVGSNGGSNAKTTDSGNSRATGTAASPSATETNSAVANAAPSSVFALAVAGAVLVAALGY